MNEVAPTGATAWGALARTPAVQTIRFWPEGELLILGSYRRDPGRTGVMLLGRRASGWEKLWNGEQDGCGIERLQLADVLGEGKPQLLVGWYAGPSLGGRLEVLSWTGNGLESVAVLGYHRLDVVDLSGIYARDGRCELAVWTKDTGDAYAVEVYRWHEVRFVPAPDTNGTYYPVVVDYYAQRTREHPDVRAYWYYLALARVRAQEARAALDSLVRARGLDGHPADAALFLVEGDALCALGRYGDALAAYSRAAEGGPRFQGDARCGQGACLLALGRVEEARAEFRRALEESGQEAGSSTASHGAVSGLAASHGAAGGPATPPGTTAGATASPVVAAARGLAVADLLPHADALAGFLRDCGPAAGGSGDLLGRLGAWAGKQGLAVHALLAAALALLWSRVAEQPRQGDD